MLGGSIIVLCIVVLSLYLALYHMGVIPGTEPQLDKEYREIYFGLLGCRTCTDVGYWWKRMQGNSDLMKYLQTNEEEILDKYSGEVLANKLNPMRCRDEFGYPIDLPVGVATTPPPRSLPPSDEGEEEDDGVSISDLPQQHRPPNATTMFQEPSVAVPPPRPLLGEGDGGDDDNTTPQIQPFMEQDPTVPPPPVDFNNVGLTAFIS